MPSFISLKKLGILALLALPCALPAKESTLVLHFDVNGTIMAADSVNLRGADEALIQKLAEEVYGRWDGRTFTSYTEYVAKRYPEKQDKVRELNRLFEVMEKRRHPQLKAVRSEFTALLDKISEGPVFPSFYRLVDYLEEEQIPYTVHLRTFGGDGEAVKRDIEEKLEKSFFTGRLWSKGGTFVDEEGPIPFHVAYQTFCEENIVGQEDWAHWLSNGKTRLAGKPFPIDVEDVGRVSIFFDDHIQKGSSPVNIVMPVDLEGNPLDVETLIASGQLCHVDTLEAIRDPDYFIKKVEFARDRSRTYTPYGTRT